MKLFVDSADVDVIRAAAATELVDGVTMNARLLAEAGLPIEELVRAACTSVRGPVCVPAEGESLGDLIRSARAVASLHERVLVKLPIHAEGLLAMVRLRAEGIRTHATQCLTANQALLAAKSGASFVSPFLGRVEEMGGSGTELLADILAIFGRYGYETQVMAASLRRPSQVLAAARAGAHACTLPWPLLQSLSTASEAAVREGRGEA